MRRLNTFIGSPLERVEDFRLLRGRGQYVDDLARPGQWHAAIVRSQVAHGRIRSIDTGAALAMPGVRAVLTAADIGPPIPIIPFRRPIIVSNWILSCIVLSKIGTKINIRLLK